MEGREGRDIFGEVDGVGCRELRGGEVDEGVGGVVGFLILRSHDINTPYPPQGLACRGASRG